MFDGGMAIESVAMSAILLSGRLDALERPKGPQRRMHAVFLAVERELLRPSGSGRGSVGLCVCCLFGQA